MRDIFIVSLICVLEYECDHLFVVLCINLEDDACCESCGAVNSGVVARERRLCKAAKQKQDYQEKEELKRLRQENKEFRRKEFEKQEDERLAAAAAEAELNMGKNSGVTDDAAALRDAEALKRKKLRESKEAEDKLLNSDTSEDNDNKMNEDVSD